MFEHDFFFCPKMKKSICPQHAQRLDGADYGFLFACGGFSELCHFPAKGEKMLMLIVNIVKLQQVFSLPQIYQNVSSF
jgi:hypothetical protein